MAHAYDPAAGGSPLTMLQGPPDGVAYFEVKTRVRGLVAATRGAEAEPLAERLTRDYPHDPANWLLLAGAKAAAGKHGEAADAYMKAHTLTGLAWIPYEAAARYAMAGERRKALDVLTR